MHRVRSDVTNITLNFSIGTGREIKVQISHKMKFPRGFRGKDPKDVGYICTQGN
jgi:hypothetical protein